MHDHAYRACAYAGRSNVKLYLREVIAPDQWPMELACLELKCKMTLYFLCPFVLCPDFFVLQMSVLTLVRQ